jgi:hypothetical protein
VVSTDPFSLHILLSQEIGTPPAFAAKLDTEMDDNLKCAKKNSNLTLRAIAQSRIETLRGQPTFRQNSANNTRTTRRRDVLRAKPAGIDSSLDRPFARSRGNQIKRGTAFVRVAHAPRSWGLRLAIANFLCFGFLARLPAMRRTAEAVSKRPQSPPQSYQNQED